MTNQLTMIVMIFNIFFHKMMSYESVYNTDCMFTKYTLTIHNVIDQTESQAKENNDLTFGT